MIDVTEHLPLVRHFAGKAGPLATAACDLDDLISAGSVGLVKAASRYDPERGVPFANYASPRVKGAILDEVRRMAFVEKRTQKPGYVEPVFVTWNETIDRSHGPESEYTWADVIPDPRAEQPERSLILDEARAAIAKLPKRERQVIELYYDGELRMREIAALMRVSPSRVCQLHRQGLRRLRKAMGAS